jgi:TolA-binding protein
MRGFRHAVLIVALGAAPAWAQPGDRAYRAGIGLLNKGMSDLAAAEFRAYLAEQPEGPEALNARYSLAVCLTRLGRHEEALVELRHVNETSGFEFAGDALLLMGQCQLAAGRGREAAAVLRRLVDEHPACAQLDAARTLLGETLYRLGEHKDALVQLGGVAERWPESGWAARAELFAAMAELGAGDAKGAAGRAARLRAAGPAGEYAHHAALVEARARQQLGESAAALGLYEAAGKGPEPVRSEALLGEAAMARAQGDLVRAERALASIAEEAARGVREWAALERGKLLFDGGKFAEAGRVFAEGRRAGEEAVRAEASYWFARCQVRQGKHAEAVANLEAAAERFAGSAVLPDILFERAAALSLAGEEEGAYGAWGEWLERFGSGELAGEALLARAWCAHRLGRFEESERLLIGLEGANAEKSVGVTAVLLRAENAFARERYEEALAAYTGLRGAKGAESYAARAGLRGAVCLVKLGRVDEGAVQLEAALKLGGEPGLRRGAITVMADGLFSRQQWEKAGAWFERLEGEAGEPAGAADARLRRAICLQRLSRHAEALQILEAVAGGDWPAAEQAAFERGQSLLELGRLDEARRVFEALGVDGSGAFAGHVRRHLASIASRQGRHAEAAELLARGGDAGAGLEVGSALLGAGKYAEAEAALSRYLETGPGGAEADRARVLRAIAVSRQGRVESVLEELRAAPASLNAETRASAAYELAVGLRSLGRLEEARAAFESLLEGSTSRLGVYARLEVAQLELQAKKHERALKLLDEALAAAPGLAGVDSGVVGERAVYLRGACLLQMGRGREAAEALKGFAAAYPGSSLVHAAALVRGEALLAAGDARGAAGELSMAAEGGAEEVRSSALLRLGEAWAGAQDWAASERAYGAFLERSGGSPVWYQAQFGLGWALENQGRHDEAISAYRRVLERHEGATAARAQFQVGECLYTQKKFEQAVAEFLKTDVLFAYPEWSAAALYEAGRCLREMGRAEDAAKQFDEVVQRFPGTRWATLAAEQRKAAAPQPVPGRGAATKTR